MKKLISVVMSAAFLMSAASVALAENQFTDLAGFEWAAADIEKMAAMEYISGYGKGIFMPNKDITHIEGLVLFARAMGTKDKNIQKVLNFAYEEYKDTAAKWNLPYGDKEICYLLYRGAFTKDELTEYLSEENMKTPLKRYEAAKIITKTMAKDFKVEEPEITLDYADAADIPESAFDYVYFVTQNKIMTGMDGDIFSPNTSLKRSQMAVMLSRAVDAMGMKIVKTTLNGVDESAFDTKDGKFAYSGTTVIYKDGKKAEISGAVAGMEIILTVQNDKAVFADILSENTDKKVYGTFKSFTKDADKTTVEFIENETGEIMNLECADGFTVTVDGQESDIDKCKDGDVVAVEISDDKIVGITIDKNIKIIDGAYIEEIGISKDLVIKISHSDEKYDGMKLDLAKDVEVVKNGKAAELSDIYRGDRVNIITEDGYVKKMTATSNKEAVNGVIKEIHISTAPYVVVEVNNKDVKYDISKTAKITKDGKETAIYDFRIRDTISLVAESMTATELEVTSSQGVADSITAGHVEAVNISYGFINVSYSEDGVAKNETVYCKDGTTTVINASGKTVKLSDIEVGSKLTIRGTIDNGDFVASVILIEDK